MGRSTKKLKPFEIKAIVDAGKPGMHAVGDNLYIQIKETASKNLSMSWIFRCTINGKRRDIGLGSLKKRTYAGARELLADKHLKIALGRDPIAENQASRAQTRRNNKSFSLCAEQCIKAKMPEWKNDKTLHQWQTHIKEYANPVIGNLPVASVNKQHVLKILEPIWQTKTETAVRVMRRIAAVWDYGKAHEWCSGDNPAKWEGNLDAFLPKPKKIHKVVNFTALPYKEVAAFMTSLKAMEGIPAVALRFTILTAVRTNETIGAVWDEIDLDEKVWVIPRERMKRDKEHRVPLSDEVVDILESLPRISKYVFPGFKEGRPISNMAMLKVLKRMGRDDLTVHGFRSTFRDWAADTTNFPQRVMETALAHKLKDGVEERYERTDLLPKRAKLMAAWAQYCEASKSDVLPMRA